MATVGVGSGVVLLERQHSVGVVILERRSAMYCWSWNDSVSPPLTLPASQTTKEPSQTFRHPEIVKATLS